MLSQPGNVVCNLSAEDAATAVHLPDLTALIIDTDRSLRLRSEITETYHLNVNAMMANQNGHLIQRISPF
jgi:hypothetical protein